MTSKISFEIKFSLRDKSGAGLLLLLKFRPGVDFCFLNFVTVLDIITLVIHARTNTVITLMITTRNSNFPQLVSSESD